MEKDISSVESKKNTVYFALELGKLLMESGSEIYRVEDSVRRALQSRDIGYVDVFAVPTGLFVSCEISGERKTILERIKTSSIDLEKIGRLNDISRAFTFGIYDEKQAMEELEKVKSLPKYNTILNLSGACVGGGFLVFLFGGGLIEFLLSALATGLTTLGFSLLMRKQFNFFIAHMIGGLFCGLSALVLVKLFNVFGISSDIHLITIGPLMTLVPGVALTNGMRDVISGDLVAGMTKIMEAIFIAIALAFGVGILLQVAMKYIGVIVWN